MFTHVWLALFGLWSWEQVPALPPEIMLLPAVGAAEHLRLRLLGAPDDRRAVGRAKPTGPCARCRSTSTSCTAREPWRAPARRRSRPRARWLARGWTALLRAYERRPIGPLRRLALARAERWIVRRQEADGSWGGIQPPWVYSLIALHLCGYPLDHPVMRAASRASSAS